MSRVYCPYDVGAPSTWLPDSGLEYDRKACAIPIGLNCGLNQDALSSCCGDANQQYENTTQGIYLTVRQGISVCALPVDATNTTYQTLQDCILNYPGRDGGFRCNDLDSLNKGPNCNSQAGVINVPVNPPRGQQACIAEAVANTSSVFQQCCGSPAISYEGGCWQYCVGPADQDIGSCIGREFSARNITYGGVLCNNGTARDTATRSVAPPSTYQYTGSSVMALFALVMCMTHLL